jgi:hypothetical protein
MWVALVAIAGLLATLVWLARECGVVMRTSAFVMAGFWSLAFLGRPLAVYLDQPSSPSLNPLADYRLAWFGYEEGLKQVLTIVAMGLGMSVIILALLRRTKVARAQPSVWQPYWSATLATALALGWVGRSMEPFWSPMGLLAILVTPSLALLVCFANWTRTPFRVVLILLAAAGEAGWSVLAESKTPIVALLLALLIWATRSLSVHSRRLAYICMTFLVLTVFVAIQPLKGAYFNDANRYSSHFTGPVGDFAMTVLTRTDLISAVTDAVSTARPPSFAPGAYVARVGRGLTPDHLVSKGDDPSGLVWTRDLRAATNPKQFLGVSLADGPIAEGYVLGGIAGVLALSAIMMIATILLCAGISAKSLWIRCLCAMVVFGPTLYERGPLGLSEVVGKGLQYAVVVAVLIPFAKAIVSKSHFLTPRALQAFRNERPLRVHSGSTDGGDVVQAPQAWAIRASFGDSDDLNASQPDPVGHVGGLREC